MRTASKRITVMMIALMMLQGILLQTVSHARTLRPPLEADVLSLPEGRVGQNYEYELRTEGGLAPFTWRVVGGELPPGISLEVTGKLTGLPGTPRREAYSFVVEVSDSSQPPQRFARAALLMIQAVPLRIASNPSALRIADPERSKSFSPLAPDLTSSRTSRNAGQPSVRVAGSRAINESAASSVAKTGADSTAGAAQPAKPTVDPINIDAEKVTGKANANATVLVFKKDSGSALKSTADANGFFTVPLAAKAAKGDEYRIQQQVGTDFSDFVVITVAPPEDCQPPVLNQVNENAKVISGKKAGPGNTVQVYVNSINEVAATTTADATGEWSATLPTPVPRDAHVWVNQKCGEKTSKFSPMSEAVTPMDLTHPNLIGLAPFGIVMSQQADRFSQADPFGGFVIGYMSTARQRYVCRRKIGAKDSKDDECHFLTVQNRQEMFKDFFRAYAKSKETKDTENEWQEELRFKPHLNVRIQGIFESDGRAATAPAAATSNNTNGGSGTPAPAPMEPVSFVASRKSFDVDLHMWYEWRFLHSPVFHWGPYGAIGGSFLMSKNELNGEGVAVDTGGGGNSVPLDTTKVITSNDGKLYYEGGLALNFYNPDENDSNLYVQAFLAFGHYEAFADLRPTANTKFRGVGKLRVFPFGLNRNFFSHGVVTPMFGIDLNAGKGPDQVKFFIGSVLNITKFIDKLKGAPPTASNP